MAQLRNEAGLTQREIALALGVTDKTVSNWELGNRTLKLTPSQTLTLCGLLKCDLETLVKKIEAGRNE